MKNSEQKKDDLIAHGLCSAVLVISAIVTFMWARLFDQGMLTQSQAAFNWRLYVPLPLGFVLPWVLGIWWRTRAER